MAEIPGLYSTGIGFSVNTEDTNWALSVVSGTCTTGSYGYVAADNEPDERWDESELTAARWLTPGQNARQNYGLCTFRWRLSFSIPTEYDPASARISLRFESDDTITIRLNGTSKITGGGFYEWTSKSIVGGFVTGTNTLDADVVNAVNASPTGLRIDFVSSFIGPANAIMFSCNT